MIVQCAECKTSYRLQAELVPPRRVQTRCNRCGHVFAIVGPEAGGQGFTASRGPNAAASIAPQAPTSSNRYGDVDLGAAPAREETRAAPPFVPPLAPAPQAPARAANPTPPQAAPAPAAAHDSAPISGGRDMDLQLERSEGFPAASPRNRDVAGVNSPAAAPMEPARRSGVALETPPNGTPSSFRELDLDETALNAAPSDEAPANPEEQRKHDKSRRLARALVSDILVYNRAKRDAALQSGKLVQELGPEIKKSWEVYKERVTPEVANSTNHFREALNDILADGQPIF